MNRHHQALRQFLHVIGRFPLLPSPNLLPVPFFRHEAAEAGAAALAMILSFYGRRVSVRGLSGKVAGSGWGGTAVPRALAEAAHHCGFDSRVERGDVARLAEWLEMGIPPLVVLSHAMREVGEPVVVVTGISPTRDAVRVHYGATPHQWLTVPDFLMLCGGESFPAVVIHEKIRPANSMMRTHERSFWSASPARLTVPEAAPLLAA